MAHLYISRPAADGVGEDMWVHRVSHAMLYTGEEFEQALWDGIRRVINSYDQKVYSFTVGRLPVIGDYEEYTVTVRYDARERGRTQTEGAVGGEVPAGDGGGTFARELTAAELVFKTL